jgi:hypothetical protein
MEVQASPELRSIVYHTFSSAVPTPKPRHPVAAVIGVNVRGHMRCSEATACGAGWRKFVRKVLG